MSPEVTYSADEQIVTGNTYDKYGSTNPVVRRLMTGFGHSLDELMHAAAPTSLLDIGCGEGVLTRRWAAELGDARVVGIDLEDPQLQAQWEQHAAPNLQYQIM